MTLSRLKGIPTIPTRILVRCDLDSFPYEEVEFDHVVNRLKVLSGFDPVHNAEPLAGVFLLEIGGAGEFEVRVRFSESDSDSSVGLSAKSA